MKPAELFDLSNEVAVVIGATGALGGAVAEGLAEAGARIAVVGRKAERGNARARPIEAATRRHMAKSGALERRSHGSAAGT